jgi:hypothetical protein
MEHLIAQIKCALRRYRGRRLTRRLAAEIDCLRMQLPLIAAEIERLEKQKHHVNSELLALELPQSVSRA